MTPFMVFEVQYRKDNLSYGFSDTGHGIQCSNCHDASLEHIDGQARTYAPSLGNYQAGYRLKLANVVPRHASEYGVDPDDYELCFDCHDSAPFTSGSGDLTGTNFEDEVLVKNDHFIHLAEYGEDYFDSDFDTVQDSDMTCTACHNVHGSPTPAMIRHGELIDHAPGLNLRYVNNTTGDPDGYMSEACIEDPENPGNCDYTVPYSSGAVTYFWDSTDGTVLKNGICEMCHNDFYPYTRTPEYLTMTAP